MHPEEYQNKSKPLWLWQWRRQQQVANDTHSSVVSDQTTWSPVKMERRWRRRVPADNIRSEWEQSFEAQLHRLLLMKNQKNKTSSDLEERERSKEKSLRHKQEKKKIEEEEREKKYPQRLKYGMDSASVVFVLCLCNLHIFSTWVTNT